MYAVLVYTAHAQLHALTDQCEIQYFSTVLVYMAC